MRPSLIAGLLLLSFSSMCVAQQREVCGLRTITETGSPTYPPIAKAAHVEGNVIMLVSFRTDGEVDAVNVVSGPKMLELAAIEYVKKWRANAYTGPRTCPIVVRFQMFHPGGKTVPELVHTDLQHVVITEREPLIQPMPSSVASAR